MPTTQPLGWVELAVTVPATHLGSLYAWMGEWLGSEDDEQRGNVRHLIPPGEGDATQVLDAAFTIPAPRVEDFYGQLAGWWRSLDAEGHQKDDEADDGSA